MKKHLIEIIKHTFSWKAARYRAGAFVWVVFCTWVIQQMLGIHPAITALIIISGKHIYYGITEWCHHKNKVCRHCGGNNP